MVKIEHEDACRAARNVAAYFNYEARGNHQYFWRFVGVKFSEYFRKQYFVDPFWELPDEVGNRVLACASGNHACMISALKARGHSIHTLPSK